MCRSPQIVFSKMLFVTKYSLVFRKNLLCVERTRYSNFSIFENAINEKNVSYQCDVLPILISNVSQIGQFLTCASIHSFLSIFCPLAQVYYTSLEFSLPFLPVFLSLSFSTFLLDVLCSPGNFHDLLLHLFSPIFDCLSSVGCLWVFYNQLLFLLPALP